MRKKLKLLAAVGGVATGLCAAQSPAAPLTAFPGAEGFGAMTTGGRGGMVCHVTNLDDSGPGSLRDAIAKPGGPRVIVFDVGGYIALKSILQVRSDITLAGQTAPGDGIGLRDSEVSFSGAHNIVVRYVRFRQGLVQRQDKKSAINIYGGNDLIFDHVSIQWGRWDTVDMNNCTNVTIQNSIIGPGVAPQRFGCLCQSDNVSFLRNLWISNQSRNPKAKGRVEYVNNVVYNWGVSGYVGGHSAADHVADIINNYFIKGPSSNDRFAGEFKPTDHIFQDGNLVDLDRDGSLNGRLATAVDFGKSDGPTLVNARTAEARVHSSPQSALAAYHSVVARAGASMHRDAVDARLIDDLTSLGKRGSTVHDPAEMGGFGELKGGATPVDSDGDGLPDFWEKAAGSDPTKPDAAEPVASGYTRLDEYLNWLAGPHGTTARNRPMDFDLRALTGSVVLAAEFSRAANCSVKLLADGTVRVTPDKDFTGRARFDFAAAEKDGVTNTFELLVTPE
jgi:hypothetical protein